jgi:hypothetical protein
MEFIKAASLYIANDPVSVFQRRGQRLTDKGLSDLYTLMLTNSNASLSSLTWSQITMVFSTKPGTLHLFAGLR